MSYPLFTWLHERAVGVMLHPTCLPSDLGIGNFGSTAYRFLQFMKNCGFRHWQMCPLGPTGYGDSPYQCFSAFAGNPYLIDLNVLIDVGLLKKEDLEPLRQLPHHEVDYGRLYQLFWPIVKKAHAAFVEHRSQVLFDLYGSYEVFKEKNFYWLDPFTHFCTLKDHFDDLPWWNWPKEYRCFKDAKSTTIFENKNLQLHIDFCTFLQYLFFGQFQKLKDTAKAMGIQLIGDIPIFAAADSADLWCNPELFRLNKATLKPVEMAGVPPDYFTQDGQLWGNPTYDWPVHAKTEYKWWVDRVKFNLKMFDTVRLDHFRGFYSYWAVKAGSQTARFGTWKPGPRLALFKALQKAVPKARLIAEDLGLITSPVRQLMHKTGLPGMAILQFAFGSGKKNDFLPHNLHQNQVVYPSSHDTDTALGWYKMTNEATKDYCRRYLQVDGHDVAWDLIRCAYRTVCALAIVTMQDLMSLDNSARMNYPGSAQGNWKWRFTYEQMERLERNAGPYLLELKEVYGR
jgi:4-alpha-glucanotransferase